MNDLVWIVPDRASDLGRGYTLGYIDFLHASGIVALGRVR